jgi:hypothetical protein
MMIVGGYFRLQPSLQCEPKLLLTRSSVLLAVAIDMIMVNADFGSANLPDSSVRSSSTKRHLPYFQSGSEPPLPALSRASMQRNRQTTSRAIIIIILDRWLCHSG